MRTLLHSRRHPVYICISFYFRWLAIPGLWLGRFHMLGSDSKYQLHPVCDSDMCVHVFVRDGLCGCGSVIEREIEIERETDRQKRSQYCVFNYERLQPE